MQKSNEGLIISYFGNSVAVEADDGQVFQCHLHRNQALPVVGDRVKWQLEKGETGVVTSIEPRHSLLARGGVQGKRKPIAANIDFIIIVMAPRPIFSEYLIDRYLVAAELLKIKPIILVNKSDLLTTGAQQETEKDLAPYSQIPYPTLMTSVVNQVGLTSLSAYLQDKRGVLVGPSGVGKSSIIAALGGDDAIRIGEVAPKGGGKHTTTATRLYHLPGGASLIDSPGVREFNLWPVSARELLSGFKEFENFLKDCKFRDCQHTVEPGCSVQGAVQAGKISAKRFANYQLLLKEAKGQK